MWHVAAAGGNARERREISENGRTVASFTGQVPSRVGIWVEMGKRGGGQTNAWGEKDRRKNGEGECLTRPRGKARLEGGGVRLVRGRGGEKWER